MIWSSGQAVKARLWLCKPIMQEVLHKFLTTSSKKDLALKARAVQHPAFQSLAPRVGPRVRVLGAFTADTQVRRFRGSKTTSCWALSHLSAHSVRGSRRRSTAGSPA